MTIKPKLQRAVVIEIIRHAHELWFFIQRDDTRNGREGHYSGGRRAFIRACYFVVVSLAFNVTVRRDTLGTRNTQYVVSTRIFRKSVSSWRKIFFLPFPFLFPSFLLLPELPIFFITFLISYPPASVTVIQIPIVIYVDINGNPQGCPVVTPSPLSRQLQDAATFYDLHYMRPWVQILYFIESEREREREREKEREREREGGGRSCHCYCRHCYSARFFSFFLQSTDWFFLQSLSFAFHGWR